MTVHATLNPGHIIAVIPTIIHRGGVPGPGTVRSPKAPVLWAPTFSDGGAPPTSVDISVRFTGFVQCFFLPSCRSGASILRFILSTGLLPVLLGDSDTQNATVGVYSYLAKRAPGCTHSLSQFNRDTTHAPRSIISRVGELCALLRDRRFASVLFWVGVMRILDVIQYAARLCLAELVQLTIATSLSSAGRIGRYACTVLVLPAQSS